MWCLLSIVEHGWLEVNLDLNTEEDYSLTDEYCSGIPDISQTWTCWSEAKAEPGTWLEVWSTFPMRNEIVPSGEEKVLVSPNCSLSVPKGSLQERRRETFYKRM